MKGKEQLILKSEIYTLNTPVVIVAYKEQSLARFLIIERCIDFPHVFWQSKTAKTFRIARYRIIATESPHFLTCVEMKRNYCLVCACKSK